MRVSTDIAVNRNSGRFDYKSKVIIASEGRCSEPRYFAGLNKSVLTENTQIINLLRDYSKKNNSHPNFIISMYREFLINNDDKITIKEIKNRISNYNKDDGNRINTKPIFDLIDSKYNDDYIITIKDIEKFLFEILKKEIYEDFIENFMLYFDAQNITYSPETDSVNIVIDRDKESFFDYQYDEVLKFCRNNNINMYVSNPCFEFWLLLHFDEIENLKNDEMFANKKSSNSKRYLEQQLYKICKYKKSSLNFKVFEPNILKAIENEKNYCEDIEELKYKLGSNVGILVSKIIKENKNNI